MMRKIALAALGLVAAIYVADVLSYTQCSYFPQEWRHTNVQCSIAPDWLWDALNPNRSN